MKIGVVGCGVIGLTIAYFLEARGFDVNLVCSDLPGSSSKASGGIITVSFTVSQQMVVLHHLLLNGLPEPPHRRGSPPVA